MPSPEIRPATEADLPAVTEIYEHAVLHGTATFELIPPDLAEMTRRFNVADGRRLSLSRRVPRRPRRSAMPMPGRTGRGRPIASPWRIRSILQPAIHRRGIGLQLLQRLIAECEARGYRQMIAVIGDSANAGSIGVHTRTGFAMIGTHPNVGFKFGRWLDTVMMQRALGEGASTLPDTRHARESADRVIRDVRITTPPQILGRPVKPGDDTVRAYTTASLRSITSSTRSSSWPRRRIRPLAEITL